MGGTEIAIDVSDGHGHLMARMHISSNGEVGLATHLADGYCWWPVPAKGQ
jgi:hypothetical protein